MSDGFIDPYIDPETGILRNLVGARTVDDLARAEGEFASVRMGALLSDVRFHPLGTLADLCHIHHILFGDIYAWAGKIRTVEIRKNAEGAEFFLPSVNIPMGIEWSHAELVRDGMLKGMGSEHFAERLAYHYDNYNFVHPFREGNGRTQRLLWTCIAHDAGYDLDWRLVSGKENDEASRQAAEEREYGPLIAIFQRIATPCNPAEPLNKGLIGAGHLRKE